MNVQELIDALLVIEDKTMEVTTEGCDCDGDVGKVDQAMGEVYLRRTSVKAIGVKPIVSRFTEEEEKLLP